MEITEEQRRRAEANRLAALEKQRKRTAEAPADVPADPSASWRLVKCARLHQPAPEAPPNLDPPLPPVRFRAVLEICSPTEFSVAPEHIQGFRFPGIINSLLSINASLSPVTPVRSIEHQNGRRAYVYRLEDYEFVLRGVKKLQGVELQDIPYATRMVVQKFSHCVDRWDPDPSLPGFYTDDKVEEYMAKLPESLRGALLPFQVEGVRFGLRRGGRCLIADEMGLGKTIQAIAIACCFMDQGPILVVCPAVLRFSWAEELEHWLPFLLPKDIHLVFCRKDNLDRLERSPRVVVISYTMLNRLRKSMLNREWALMIVDESHNIRCTKKKTESQETKGVLQMAKMIPRILLLSGTPSLSRPYDIYQQINMLWPHLLGKTKYEFANNYCSLRRVQGCQGRTYMDFSKGIRLEELNVLLRQTLMIRRLKEHVLTQLPAKRRQIIMLMLSAGDILFATTSCRADVPVKYQNKFEMEHCNDEIDAANKLEDPVPCLATVCKISSRQLSTQEVGIAKLSGFCKWFSNLAVSRESENASILAIDSCCPKMLIFAHHIKVLDGVQEFICEKGLQFVRIDGGTLPRDRQAAVEAFRLSTEVNIAIIGITAGGVGIDFSSAQNVVFLELPKSASELIQAEDRAHRRGQKNAVNIYIFCAKDTSDESHWFHLNKSLFRVSSMMNGNDGAIKEIEVDRVCYLDHPCGADPEVSSKLHAVKDYSDTSDVTDGSAAEHNDTDCSSSTQKEPIQCEADTTFNAMPFNMDSGVGEKVLVDTNITNQKESLRIEVSQYTRRLHLYICDQEKDSRPRPLSKSFRPEELDSMLLSAGDTNKETTLDILKENPTYYTIFQKFIEEWSGLRPVERNKLFGKPLQLPLSLELCYLKEAINHGHGGLLKGGSKRRITPLTDISHPIPENAVQRTVVLHGVPGKEKEYLQAWSVNQEPLCKLCQKPCNGILAKTPEFLEDLFCNLGCYNEFRFRTSQRSLRDALFQIEYGVCSLCKLDCHKLVKSIKPLSIERRKTYIQEVAPKLANKKNLLRKLVCEPIEGNAWHADHIVPVSNGGGECGLENMRTLCVACHSEVTKAGQGELRLRRKREKEIVRIFMKAAENGSTSDSAAVKEGGEISEESLFVSVPGSSYSRTQVVDNQIQDLEFPICLGQF